MKGKTLYLKKISMIATRKGIKCLKNLDDIVKAYGDFELTFERSQGGTEILPFRNY